jgi:RNA polymerase sigma-70 factor (ECF subfamily)
MAVAKTSERDMPTQRVRPEFESFYEATWQIVYRPLAVVLRNPDLAQDATNEAMVRAYQRWKRLKEYDNPEGWVYRVALNWARSWLRHRRYQVRSLGNPATAVIDAEPSDPAVARAIRSLTDDHRTVIVLRYLCDLSQDEIAERLGIPIGTVRSRLHRALERLRQEVTA